jgi:hypothetical protein
VVRVAGEEACLMSARLDHARTGRLVIAGVWVCAAIVMVSSARNGALSFQALGEHPLAGFALGVAVDVALAVALVGDRALHLAGRSSAWGRALRITTCLMSGALNCAVPLWLGHVGVAAFHSFLTMLLVLLTEYAQDGTLQFGQIEDEADAAEHAEREAEQRAADELARTEQERQAQQLATLLALTPQLARRRQRTAPARAKASRQPKAPARRQTSKQAPSQAPDLAELIDRARPLMPVGRTVLARQLGVSTHWARRVIEALEAERPAGLHAVERSA